MRYLLYFRVSAAYWLLVSGANMAEISCTDPSQGSETNDCAMVNPDGSSPAEALVASRETTPTPAQDMEVKVFQHMEEVLSREGVACLPTEPFELLEYFKKSWNQAKAERVHSTRPAAMKQEPERHASTDSSMLVSSTPSSTSALSPHTTPPASPSPTASPDLPSSDALPDYGPNAEPVGDSGTPMSISARLHVNPPSCAIPPPSPPPTTSMEFITSHSVTVSTPGKDIEARATSIARHSSSAFSPAVSPTFSPACVQDSSETSVATTALSLADAQTTLVEASAQQHSFSTEFDTIVSSPSLSDRECTPTPIAPQALAGLFDTAFGYGEGGNLVESSAMPSPNLRESLLSIRVHSHAEWT